MDKTRSSFVDFIPQGEEAGAPIGKNGFADFVPVPQPKAPEPIQAEVIKEEVTVETPKKKK